jgi:hypothetical protein
MSKKPSTTACWIAISFLSKPAIEIFAQSHPNTALFVGVFGIAVLLSGIMAFAIGLVTGTLNP